MKDNFDYLDELVRMCKSFSCTDCPLTGYHNCNARPGFMASDDNIDEVKQIIKEWSEAHPIITRSTEFKKIYPNCKVDEYGYPTICPNELDITFKGACDRSLVSIIQCEKCRQDYWDEEVKCSE